MPSAHREICVFEEDLAVTLRESMPDSNYTYEDIAAALGKSTRTVRYYGSYGRYDLNCQNNRLKAHELPFLPPSIRSVILRSILHKAKAKEEIPVDGSLDDDVSNIVEILSGIRKRFNEGEKITHLHKDILLNLIEKLFAEIDAKQDGLVVK